VGASPLRISLYAMFAKINISGQLADDVDVNDLRARSAVRATNCGARRRKFDRPEVDVQTKFLGAAEQTVRRLPMG